MKINHEKFNAQAKKMHTRAPQKIKKFLAAGFASLAIATGLSLQGWTATANYQQVQHDLQLYVAAHPDYYEGKYHHFQSALIPEIKKELKALNTKNLVGALNENRAGNSSNIIEVLLVDLLQARQEVIAPKTAFAQRRVAYQRARRAEYNLTRLGLYPAIGLDQQPSQTLDEFYMDFINLTVQTGKHSAAGELLFTIMEKEQELLQGPRTTLRKKSYGLL